MRDISHLLEPGDTRERCGFILKNGKVVEVMNVSETPEQAFRMHPGEMVKYVDRAEATWHTHPDTDPNLTEQDYAGFMQWPALDHYIVGVRGGVVTTDCFRVVDGLVVGL